MDEDLIKESQAEAQAGVGAFQDKDKAEAGRRFWNALNRLDGIQDAAKKRQELGPLALRFARLGFFDLALMAVQEAIELDEKLNDLRHLAEDLITHGNVCLNLGRTEEAVGIQKRALKISLDNGDYANAASASTNLALIVGRQGRMDEAINLLKSSLAYLEKKPHPNTEIITRLALIQALGAEQREPELAVNVARELFKRFSDKLRPDQRNAVTGPLKNIIRRHPELEPEEWKRENSPWGYGG